MKNLKLINMLAFSTASICVSAVNAQQDTVRIIQQPLVVIVHDTVLKEETKTERPPLRRGEFGIRYMPTFSSLDLKTYNGETVHGSATVAHGAAVMLGFNFNKHIGIQAEVDYYMLSQNYQDRNMDRKVKISYLNIPVLLSLNTDKTRWINLNVVAGPQFGINVGSDLKTTGDNGTDSLHAVVALKKGDVGFAYGAGLEFALNMKHTVRLDLGYRGFYGLVDMDAKSNDHNSYNIILKTARKTDAAYLGLTLVF
jgi:opacity protein-like surface antigen